MLHKIHQLLSHKSYLIVMDDVWSTASGWWDRISSGLTKTLGHSSCIIITTRNEEVTKNIGVVDALIHRPKLLDKEESWSLFCKVVFMATKGICKNLQIEGLGKEIVKKCQGLPFTIKGWISSLKRLTCLNLRDVASLLEVPNSIGKLLNLQILILVECIRLQKLPASITTLHKLTILDLENCPALKYLPQGISSLSNLQELYRFKLASLTHTKSCHFGKLKNFLDLRVLHLDINQESTIEDEELRALADLQKLRVLLINGENCEEVNILEKLNKLTLSPHLEELYFGHYHEEATSDWINPNSLPELQYLCLEYVRLVDMSPLFWSSDGGNSWKVEGLCLKFLPRLQVEWSRVQGVMPSLRGKMEEEGEKEEEQKGNERQKNGRRGKKKKVAEEKEDGGEEENKSKKTNRQRRRRSRIEENRRSQSTEKNESNRGEEEEEEEEEEEKTKHTWNLDGMEARWRLLSSRDQLSPNILP
ncbi:Disease resistance RPP13-like protein 4 [Camellia lanceoleosa]|uniref:Disease resistance RPP13-like protein 4 n=1 Tax=Camellia lanceoleosa TaxID=1840588 RepID=A0ACC0H4N2_9ERIC|nr:Disease resistance RPP13-like protein 4 [Camellia lanceoleosa]